jgi:hypothetical protein
MVVVLHPMSALVEDLVAVGIRMWKHDLVGVQKVADIQAPMGTVSVLFSQGEGQVDVDIQTS